MLKQIMFNLYIVLLSVSFSQDFTPTSSWRYELVNENINEPLNANGYNNLCYTKNGYFVATGYFKRTLMPGYSKFYSKLLITCLKPNGEKYWEKSYGDTGTECIGNSVVECADGFFVLGTKRIGSEDMEKAWILKLDSSGDTLWTKTYWKKYNNGVGSIFTTNDGGAIVNICVDTTDENGGCGYNWNLRLDSLGDTLFSKFYAYKDLLFLKKAFSTDDGGFLGGGRVVQFADKYAGILLMKFDQNIDTIWTREYQFNYGFNSANDIQKVGNDGYVIAGSANNQFTIIRIDNDGKTRWIKQYGNRSINTIYSIKVISNGDFLVCGTITGLDDYYDATVMRLDQNGDSLNCFIYVTPGRGTLYSSYIIDEHNFMVCGNNQISLGNNSGIIYTFSNTPPLDVRSEKLRNILKNSLRNSSSFDLSGKLVPHGRMSTDNLANGIYVKCNSKIKSTAIFGTNYSVNRNNK